MATTDSLMEPPSERRSYTRDGLIDILEWAEAEGYDFADNLNDWTIGELDILRQIRGYD